MIKVLELENKVKKLSCDQCEHVFETKDNLDNPNDIPTTSKCGSCDFESDDEKDVKIHTKTTHDLVCKICELTFESEKKFKMHTCRVHIVNPEYGDYYTKMEMERVRWGLSHINWIPEYCLNIYRHPVSHQIHDQVNL